MIVDRRWLSLEIEIPPAEGLRLLGIKHGGRTPRSSVMSCYQEELELAGTLIAPRAVVASCLAGLPDSKTIPEDVPHALVVCTIGAELEQRVQRLNDLGDSARAMILDAIGSAAVEELADRLNLELCERALAEDRFPGPRRSPGYGGWALSEQRLIFELLRPSETGILLNESCMMTPSKSISFAMPLEGGEQVRSPRGRCARCGMQDCEYRSIPTGERSDAIE